MEPFFAVRGIEAAYGRLQVLWGVDLELAQGEVAVLLGSNGAGKTTLLKALMGLRPLLRGEILLGGQHMERLRTDLRVQRGIHYMTELGVFPNLSVDENLQVGGFGLPRHDLRQRIADLYEHGNGVKQSYGKALKWLRRAAAEGDAYAALAIGRIYKRGRGGVRRNYGKAVRWLRRAAEKGVARAMERIADLYEHGDGVRQGYGKALNWEKKAAAMGYAPAMGRIGVMYAKGLGVKVNYKAAKRWFKREAAAGDPSGKQALDELKVIESLNAKAPPTARQK